MGQDWCGRHALRVARQLVAHLKTPMTNVIPSTAIRSKPVRTDLFRSIGISSPELFSSFGRSVVLGSLLYPLLYHQYLFFW